ncbi:hypothetical protein [Cecembia rubra]|uniref:Uncharacterized protein n=1 Tax=Cecembia rubra TaxID=1485585 RepID=A0A2P8DXH4_9BACT|nr:hypothetical protein [Cecembia rubra]PSL01918.1 hypothetical protein CLV48_1116 [Cecembia rubra]
MTAQKQTALIGTNPINAIPAYGIQSKAVFKCTQFLEYLSQPNLEILLFAGVEACNL